MKLDTFKIFKEIMEQRLFLLEEIFKVYFEYYRLKHESSLSLNSQEMNNTLKKALTFWTQSINTEKYLYNFVLKNINKINISDLYYTFDFLDQKFVERYNYMEEVFENFSIALDVRREDRFYLPKNVEFLFKNKKLEQYKHYLQGYNMETLEYILIEEQLFTSKNFDLLFKNRKDSDGSIQNSVTFTNNLNPEQNETGNIISTLPEITDEQSFLINMSQLIKYTMMNHPEIASIPAIVNGNDIPIFYQLLFQKTNPFSSIDIVPTEIAEKLLKEYKNEPFLEQIEKVKKYIN